MKFKPKVKENSELFRMMYYQLKRELADHLGPPPYYEHIGITDDLTVIPNIILNLGWRIKGMHISCVSGEYKIYGKSVEIACVIFGDYSNEYHLAYIGDNADDLNYLVIVINAICVEMNLPTYDWRDKTNGKSAHIL